MDKSSLVSVIIPVYKAERYLRRCLDSLCNQTYNSLEIIAVNDGSPDNCMSILREYETKDHRILVFDKENGGANSARNFALSQVNGDWITFVDSDDWLDSNYIRELMEHANSDCQLICGGFRLNNKGLSYRIEHNAISTNVIDSIELLHKTYFGMIYNVWGKLFKKEIIIKYSLNFKSFLRHDGIFLLDYIYHIKNINIISTSSYLHYNTENTNSLTHKMFGIEKMMLDLYRYYNSFAKLVEKDYSNFDRYNQIINMDKTLSFCGLLHETYPLPFKQKIYWYKRMIDQLPHFNISYLSPYLNRFIHKCLRLAFNIRSPFFIYCIVELHLIRNKIITILHI